MSVFYEHFNINLHTMEPLDWRLDHLLCLVERHDGFLVCTDCNQVFWDGISSETGREAEELCGDLRRHVSILCPVEVRKAAIEHALVLQRLGKRPHRPGGGEL